MGVGGLPEHANPESDADQKRCKEDYGYIGRDPQRDTIRWFGHAVIPHRYLGRESARNV
jgi:hypothetical protein